MPILQDMEKEGSIMKFENCKRTCGIFNYLFCKMFHGENCSDLDREILVTSDKEAFDKAVKKYGKKMRKVSEGVYVRKD
jgi:hypothetical protein